MSSVLNHAASILSDEPAALFFDVDGTLVVTDSQRMEEGANFNDFLPSPLVYRTFERIHERGHLTFLCTGRPLTLVSDGLLKLGFDGCITGAGSCVSFGDDIVFDAVIPHDVLCETVERLEGVGATALLESREQPVLFSPAGTAAAGFEKVPVARTLAEVEAIAPAMRFCKLSNLGEVSWHTESFDAFAVQHYVEYDMGLASELGIAGVDKGSGIRRALEHVGHSGRNTFAFGDSENDLPMFAAVETSVAMGDGMAAARERADYVTGPATGDGIPTALEHFGLI